MDQMRQLHDLEYRQNVVLLTRTARINATLATYRLIDRQTN